MRLAILLPVVALTGACVSVQETTRELPPGPEAAGPQGSSPPMTPASAPSPAPAISKDEAVRRAFEYAQDRGLTVNTVFHAAVDAQGRWEIEVRGPEGGDRAKMLIDGQDGRLLKGRFRTAGDAAE